MVRICAAYEVEQRSARPSVVGGDGRDDDLRKHIERVLDDPRRLNVPFEHGADDREELHGVVAERRHEHAATDRVERVTGATDPLQTVGDTFRRLQLQDEIDRPDVDAQFE